MLASCQLQLLELGRAGRGGTLTQDLAEFILADYTFAFRVWQKWEGVPNFPRPTNSLPLNQQFTG